MYVGGTLHRLISDNLFNVIKDSLDDLGWFNPNRKHKPVHLIPESVDDRDTIELNTIAISDESVDEDEMELGSTLAEHRYQYFVDIYAESKAVGQHLAGDIRDVLKGRFGSIGRIEPVLEVIDLTQATPGVQFIADLENIAQDRARVFNKPYQKYWYVVSFEVVYEYQSDLFDY